MFKPMKEKLTGLHITVSHSAWCLGSRFKESGVFKETLSPSSVKHTPQQEEFTVMVWTEIEMHLEGRNEKVLLFASDESL